MILLIDNYDSFSYNLYQMIGELDPDIKAVRNDELTVEEIEKMAPDKLIISPGPGRPENAGIIVEAAKTVAKKIPTLGVCLGHQAICMAYGAKVVHAKALMHGKQSTVELDTSCPLFKGLPQSTEVARYHSLAADAESLPDSFRITAKTTDGEIMAVQHKEYPIFGVQFHPESILTPLGREMLKNFIEM